MANKKRKLRKIILVTGILSIVAWSAAITNVNLSSRPFRLAKSADVAHKKVAIVFGAKVFGSGQVSFILKDRLDAAIELYKAKKVDKLLMSGDNRVETYNEPDAMTQYALRHGVKTQDIVQDYAGRDTYDTCYRAKNLFGVTDAVLITQQYHAPRAVYIARGLGMNVVAYAVPDFERYPTLKVPYTTREYLADIKAWWDVNLGHREAQVMGAPEPALE